MTTTTTSRALRDLTFKMSTTSRRAFAAVDEMDPAVDIDHAAYAERIAEWPSFRREVFGRLYRPGDADRAIDKPSTWAGKATSVLTALPEFPEVQRLARAHRVLAAETASTLSAAVARATGIDKLVRDKAAATDPVVAEMNTRRLAELADDDDGRVIDDDKLQLKDAAKDAAKTWAAARNRRGMIVPGDDGAIVEAVRGVAKDLRESAGRVLALRGMLAGSGIGADVYGGDIPDDLVRLLSTSPLFGKIVDRLGALKTASANASMRQTTAGNLDVVGVRAGRDPTKLVGMDRAMFGAGGALALDTMRRIVDGEASVQEQRGEDLENRGDFVLCCDKSESMAGRNVATMRGLAAMALLKAVAAKRRVVLVMFDSVAMTPVVVERGGRGIADALRMLTLEPSGGTDAVAALEAAVPFTSKGNGRVDTCVITDGAWSRDPAGPLVSRGGGEFHEIRIARGPAPAKRAGMTSLVVVDPDDINKQVAAVNDAAGRKR